MKRPESETTKKLARFMTANLSLTWSSLNRGSMRSKKASGEMVVVEAGSMRGSACTMSLDATALIWFLARRESL